MRNIVLVVLDTVRKDYFDAHAPQLQELADVSFEECRAAANTTMPSHASLMTGELPHRHGAFKLDAGFHHIDRSETALGDLSDHRSIGLSANPHLRSGFGFDDLFDEFSVLSPHRRLDNATDLVKYAQNTDYTGGWKYLQYLKQCLTADDPAASLLNAAVVKLNDKLFDSPFPRLFDDGTALLTDEATDLAADSSEPFFLFLNLMEAHAPHKNTRGYPTTDVPNTWSSSQLAINAVNDKREVEPHMEDIRRFREVYAATIEYLDQQVTDMVRRIQRHTDEPTTFIVTADHGENLGYERDDHLIGHKGSLTESLLHVPFLLINPPSGYSATETDYFSHVRVRELIRGLAAGRTPDVFDERIGAEMLGSDRYYADGTRIETDD